MRYSCSQREFGTFISAIGYKRLFKLVEKIMGHKKNPFDSNRFNTNIIIPEKGFFSSRAKLELVDSILEKSPSINNADFKKVKIAFGICKIILEKKGLLSVLNNFRILVGDKSIISGKQEATGIYVCNRQDNKIIYDKLLLVYSENNILLEFPPNVAKQISSTSDEADEKKKIVIVSILVSILHEIGHRIDFRCFSEESSEIRKMFIEEKKSLKDTPELLMSKYSGKDPKEWFAENFVAWVVDGLSDYPEKALFFDSLFGLTIPGIEDSLEKSLKPKIGTYLEVSLLFTDGPPEIIKGELVDYKNSHFKTITYKNKGLKIYNIFPTRPLVNFTIKDKCDNCGNNTHISENCGWKVVHE